MAESTNRFGPRSITCASPLAPSARPTRRRAKFRSRTMRSSCTSPLVAAGRLLVSIRKRLHRAARCETLLNSIASRFASTRIATTARRSSSRSIAAALRATPAWSDATWNPAWYVAAAGDDDFWTVEAAIPLAEIVEKSPTSRQVWAAAARRTIPRVGYESWAGDAAENDSPAPVRAADFRLSRFGLAGASPSRFALVRTFGKFC